jgi:hypothetical protein
MALGREVDDGADTALGKELFDQIGIADIALDQLDAFKARDIAQVLAAAGVGQRVEHGRRSSSP